MKWVLWLLALWGGMQYVPVAYNPGATTVTPGLVNFRGMPSSEGVLGAKVNNGCATDAYCTSLVDPSLAGNTVVVFYLYEAASGNTAITPTVATTLANGTATGDTYTHCGTDGNSVVSSNGFYVGCFYKVNATTGTKFVTLTWSAAARLAAAGAMQVYNVTGADVYSSNSGTATTTFTAGSATSTVGNDLWIQLACGTTTLNSVGQWAVGSQAGITWTPDLTDRRDACMIQRGVQTSAGALNAQLTTATSNTFASLAIAFKSGSQGTAPTGMYIQHLYTVNTEATPPNAYPLQVPVGGNLIAGVAIGGNYVLSVNDSINGQWTQCGANIGYTGDSNAQGFYEPNISAGLLNVTFYQISTTIDTGPLAFYDIAGASTTQQCNYQEPISNISATGASFTATSSYTPSVSSGISIFGYGQGFNTTTNITAPTSSLFDANYVGGQSISGPSYPDQNNGLAHLAVSSNTAASVTWTQSDSALAVQQGTNMFMSFGAPSYTQGPAEVQHAANSTATTGAAIRNLISGTYTSGITATGSTGQTCMLTTFNNGGPLGTYALVALTGTNTIASGTALTGISNNGAYFTGAPTSATASNGTATCSGTATISTTVGYKPVAAGNLLAVIGCSNASSSSEVVTDGTNTYTSVDNKNTITLNGVFCRTYDVASLSASTVTISNSCPGGTFCDVMVEEFSGVTTLDQHNLVTKTGSANIITTTSVTTTSANEAMFGAAFCSNCNLSQNSSTSIPAGKNGAPTTQENPDAFTFANTTGFRILSATGSFTMTFIDSGATANAGAAAVMTFH